MNPHRSQSTATSTNRNPYQPVGDFLSNISNFKIIESTLREGEQFANAYFDTETKIKIAKKLDEFGVDCIELTSPCASEQSRLDCEAICKLGLKAKILTHVRCHMDDVRVAVETGVDGVDVVIGTSQFLREHSHGKDMTYIKVRRPDSCNILSKGLQNTDAVLSRTLPLRSSNSSSPRVSRLDFRPRTASDQTLSIFSPSTVPSTRSVCTESVSQTLS